MAADIYLKTASTNLSRAAGAKRQEIDDLRRQTDNDKHEINRQINDLEQSIRRRQIEVAALTNNPKMSFLMAERLKEINDLKQRISMRRQEIAKLDATTADHIKALENEARDLESEAHSLDVRGS